MLDGRNDPAFHLAFLTEGESIDQLQPMPFRPVGLALVLIAAFGAFCALVPVLWAAT
jgi:hypothetical protein